MSRQTLECDRPSSQAWMRQGSATTYLAACLLFGSEGVPVSRSHRLSEGIGGVAAVAFRVAECNLGAQGKAWSPGTCVLRLSPYLHASYDSGNHTLPSDPNHRKHPSVASEQHDCYSKSLRPMAGILDAGVAAG
jgi:hypothetical protein